jgi:hypothetical protein
VDHSRAGSRFASASAHRTRNTTKKFGAAHAPSPDVGGGRARRPPPPPPGFPPLGPPRGPRPARMWAPAPRVTRAARAPIARAPALALATLGFFRHPPGGPHHNTRPRTPPALAPWRVRIAAHPVAPPVRRRGLAPPAPPPPPPLLCPYAPAMPRAEAPPRVHIQGPSPPSHPTPRPARGSPRGVWLRPPPAAGRGGGVDHKARAPFENAFLPSRCPCVRKGCNVPTQSLFSLWPKWMGRRLAGPPSRRLQRRRRMGRPGKAAVGVAPAPSHPRAR